MTRYLTSPGAIITAITACLLGAAAWDQWRTRPRTSPVERVLAAWQAYEDDLELLDGREHPPVSHGWGPDSEAAERLAVRLTPRIHRSQCGCLYGDGWWSPCRIHDTDLVGAHLDEWERELTE